MGPMLAALGGVAVLGVALVAAVLFTARAQFRANAFYQESLGMARSAPALKALLAEPIHEGWFTLGVVRHPHGADFAEWITSLEGPKGKGQLSGVAERLVGSEWHYSRLLFKADETKQIVDVTPPPARDPLLAADSKKHVFLVPLGPFPEEELAWAPAYYKTKFGLDVEVLPAVSLNSSARDTRRGQLVAENLIALMQRKLPEWNKDQSNVLIGVTTSDMYIGSYDWNYAINYRQDGRYGVVSVARLRPLLFEQGNEALMVSRLEKMITKNVYLLCFDVPLSNDATSAVSSGVMSPDDVDYMSDQIIGREQRWDPSPDGTVPTVSMVFTQEPSVAWQMDWHAKPPIDITTEYFGANLHAGLLVQSKTDFYLDGDSPLQFVRIYASSDDESREFGVGTHDSLDISLSGQPGKLLQLTQENGVTTHFDRDPQEDHAGEQAYQGRVDYFGPFSQARVSTRGYDSELETTLGWHYFFPYRPTAKSEGKYAVLTGYQDAQGHRYEMQRNADGDLLRVTTPDGKWLRFECDERHRFRRIEDSEGRTVNYDYDEKGRLVHVSDFDGAGEFYRYDDRNQMVAMLDRGQHTLLTVDYATDSRIVAETLADGRRFQYEYEKNPNGKLKEIRFADPRGYVTVFTYINNRHTQSLPRHAPDDRRSQPEPFLE